MMMKLKLSKITSIIKNKAILVYSYDILHEGLYVNSVLVKQGETLNEENRRIKYFIELSKNIFLI